MWQEKSALTTVESYFRKDEKPRIVQSLPWYYALSSKFILSACLFVAIVILTVLFFSPLPPYVIVLFCAVGFVFTYYGVTRSAYGNYVIITQYAVYRFIDKQIQQIDELPLSMAKSITVKQLRRNPKYALVSIQCHPSYAKQMPYFKRLYTLKNAQKDPEKADMRNLSLGKPIRLRLVCKNPRDTYLAFSEAKTIMGYSYTLYAKGRKNARKPS